MATQPFLLRTHDWYCDHEIVQPFYIEAESIQQVKYLYHKTLRTWGYYDTDFGKHTLESDDGHTVDIETITPLSDREAFILSAHVQTWWSP